MRALLAALLLTTVTNTPEYDTIDDLRRDTFGRGSLLVTRVVERNASFTRSEVRWDSDGHRIAGFMNVPNGPGPFPVVIVLHGYVEPTRYRLLAYTTRYADDLARAGFLVLHPNYRGHGASQGQPEGVWRTGYARDVLHLTAIVRRDAGRAQPLLNATPAVGLWGHSMGGNVAQRVAVVDPGVKAVVLYASMSGNERENARQIHEVYTRGARGRTEVNAPASVVNAISPLHAYQWSKAAWSVHHGTADTDVPPAWSREACTRLRQAGRTVECFEYPGAAHTFRGQADTTFKARVLTFFRRNLR